MPEPATGETRMSSAPTPGTRLDSQPTIGSNSGRFRERNPDMIAAGKLITMAGETTKDCLNIERVSNLINLSLVSNS